MEPVEDTSQLVAAIGWLVQTILASLLIDKLEAWIRKVGLADDVKKLKSEVERVEMEMVVAAVKGRVTGNKPLSRSLARLKELLYDADDVIDDLDYYMLQEEVEGATCHEPEGMQGEAEQQDDRSRGDADIPRSSRGKRRSEAWQHFDITVRDENGNHLKAKCKYCGKLLNCHSKTNGTRSMNDHIDLNRCPKRQASDQQQNPSSGKKMRTNEEPAHITAANTHPWNKTEFSNRIQEITRRLQDDRRDVSEVLHGSHSAASSNHYGSTTSDPRLRTSSVNQRNVYGRDAEKGSIIKLMTEDTSDGVTTVLPIIGIGGVGKTALVQLVYNDPTVESQFDHRIWVCVSNNFDEMRLLREMLDFVSQGTHEALCSYAKLQEVLRSHVKSKRVLLVLDDIWDDMNECRLNQLLSPLKSDNAKGNVIIVTTRNLSVAKRIGTSGPIKLGALENDDFWLLFKACAFGDDEGHRSLNTIGRQIADKLKGNPLAAQTAGEKLRHCLTIDHWGNILKNEDWKSLKLRGGIMPALKLSYDQLPYDLQQCFLYSSIFPYNYQFLGEELVRIWISQGFIKCNHSSKRSEETGRYYLTDLVNLGFFQQVEREESYPSNQTCYAICGLWHDFARVVSRTECATIDGIQCNEMLPTVCHLSIVTDSAYKKDLHGNIPRNEKFEEKMRYAVTSVRQLRTLVLIGQYDSCFFQSFQDIFQKAPNLRLLQMSARSADFDSFMCSLANCSHLRYLKLETSEKKEALPHVLSKCCHLQVLDVGSYTDTTIPGGINNLVSLRHLIVTDDKVYSSIASIGKMTSLQKLHDFMVQNSDGFDITQLQSMNELVQLGVSQLENVTTRDKAYAAKLRDKQHLEKLRLSWTNTLTQDDYDSGMSSEPSVGTAREVLEGLEPHLDLRHLHISGYNGNTSPTWLASNISLTSLQTLHLENCGEWEILPPLERLPLLTKLNMSNMRKAIEVSVPPVEELVLIKMPKLERCSCTSLGDLNSSLRVLKIQRCDALKVFDLFENSHKFEIEQKPWLPGLRILFMHDCPQLLVPHLLSASTTLSEISIEGVSTLPDIEGSSCESLTIEFPKQYYGEFSLNLISLKKIRICNCPRLSKEGLAGLTCLEELSIEGFSSLVNKDGNDGQANGRLLLPQSLGKLKIYYYSQETLHPCFLGNPTRLRKLEVSYSPSLKSMQLRSCTALEELDICECGSLVTLEGLQSPEASSSGYPEEGPLHLPLNLISSVKNIAIRWCPSLTFFGSKEGLAGLTSLEELAIEGFSSLVNKDGNDGQANGRLLLPQSLGQLEIDKYSQETLHPCFLGNPTRLRKLKVSSSPSLKSMQLRPCTALEELDIRDCESLAALEGLQSLGSLRYLKVHVCPSLKSMQLHSCTALEELNIRDCESLAALEGLQSLGSLRYLRVHVCPSLKSMQLRSCTALEELDIWHCESLAALEGLQSLGSLRYLYLRSPGLAPCLERLSGQCQELCPRLERLTIDHVPVLTASFCKHLTSLQRLEVHDRRIQATRLTDEQERALLLLTSLEEFKFSDCSDLVDLPAELHSFPSLKRLKIWDCCSISRLPEKGLPPSLEELDISNCSKELTDQCRKLKTSKLEVICNT